MPVLVLMLFAVALTVSLFGLYLSARPSLTGKKRRPAAAGHLLRSPSPGTPRLRARQSQIATVAQPRRRSASALSLSVAPERVYGPGSFPWREIPWKILLIGLASLLIVIFLGSQLFLSRGVGFVLPYLWTAEPAATMTSNAPASTAHYDATSHLMRINQLDPAQYDSQAQYQTWAYSACSAAAMTVVINAYGHNYRIADILKVESAIHEITPDQGLLEEVGIARTAARFRFNTQWGHNLSLDQMLAIANSGRPVIVSFPPDRFPGGHLLVVRGGNGSTVYLVDSSRLNYTSMARSRFLQLWGGFYAVLTPQAS
ncbi:C39 family peptidase [Thermogemmatispora onikobensis]|uniref:C39 family peptidase n=1 Tax=Thermogemmatispora onikobensis TaxID=732234 RepID=UPI00085368EA|nr:C39 family peptidase [Thermogemmatispora onikobensis]